MFFVKRINYKKKKNPRYFISGRNGEGFTLIEIIVVVAIIGLLASTIGTFVNSARVRSRDTKRLSDIDGLKKVLAFYELDNNTYPSSQGGGPIWKNSCDHPDDWIRNIENDGYIADLPVDPINSDSDGLCYFYRSNGVDFKIAAHMERDENMAFFGQNDGGTEDEWYEIFTSGGKNWNIPGN